MSYIFPADVRYAWVLSKITQKEGLIAEVGVELLQDMSQADLASMTAWKDVERGSFMLLLLVITG